MINSRWPLEGSNCHEPAREYSTNTNPSALDANKYFIKIRQCKFEKELVFDEDWSTKIRREPTNKHRTRPWILRFVATANSPSTSYREFYKRMFDYCYQRERVLRQSGIALCRAFSMFDGDSATGTYIWIVSSRGYFDILAREWLWTADEHSRRIIQRVVDVNQLENSQWMIRVLDENLPTIIERVREFSDSYLQWILKYQLSPSQRIFDEYQSANIWRVLPPRAFEDNQQSFSVCSTESSQRVFYGD